MQGRLMSQVCLFSNGGGLLLNTAKNMRNSLRSDKRIFLANAKGLRHK